MTNLILEFDDEMTYSDGMYLPSAEVEPMNNNIITRTIAYNSGELVAKAAIDYGGDLPVIFPENLEELQSMNSGYVVVSDAEWITIIRERNYIRFVFDVNHDTEERTASIIFKHNTEKEVYCEVSIYQEGETYELTVSQNSVNFGIEPETQTLGVTCTGGTGQYIIRKIKKYTVYTYNSGEDDEWKITKRVTFDHAINAYGTPTQLAIESNGSLITNDSYYEVTVEHKDLLGLTQTIKVNYPDYDSIGEIPDAIGDSGNGCPEENLLPPPTINLPREDEIIPKVIISERDLDVVISSSDYCTPIEIRTIPEESQLYFSYYGGFIADYVITDYIDDNDKIYHELKIKAKPNPYGFGRDCIGYVINAMYPQVRVRLDIHQEANS